MTEHTLTNEGRAERARTCVLADADDNDIETQIGDLLANLMHLCDKEGLNFRDCLDSGATRYTAETEEEAQI